MGDLSSTGTVHGGMIITDADYPGERLTINHGRFDTANTLEEVKQIVDAEVAEWRARLAAKFAPPAPPEPPAPPPPPAPPTEP